jgi:hypothetical protein
MRAFMGGRGTTTLLSMDSVRFGRALGVGARAAAKTLVTAVDAATAPNPSASTKTNTGTASSPAAPGGTAAGMTEVSGARLAEQAARTTAQVRQTGRGLKEGSRQFRKAAWGPVVKLSGVLWLELTGVFFGIFAIFAANGAWKMRGALHDAAGNHDAYVRFVLSVAMAAIFGYFCVSSFVRANRRGKRS